MRAVKQKETRRELRYRTGVKVFRLPGCAIYHTLKNKIFFAEDRAAFSTNPRPVFGKKKKNSLVLGIFLKEVLILFKIRTQLCCTVFVLFFCWTTLAVADFSWSFSALSPFPY